MPKGAYDWDSLRSTTAGGSKSKKGAYDWGSLSSPGGGQKVEQRLTAVEGAAGLAGYKPPDVLKPLALNVLDVISRGNYAAAGAAEELFTEKGGGPLAAVKRAGREIFSGLPFTDIQGDKEGFAQVMEQAGVGTGGSLSDVVPALFNDTGKGLAFKKGAWADPTLRGAGGLALDIIADPINLLTFGGGKGAQFAGKTIPLTHEAAVAVGKANKALKANVKVYDVVGDALGRTFNRDWTIRNLPGAVQLKQAHINRTGAAYSALSEELNAGLVAQIPKSKRGEFVHAMDDGTWAEKYRDDPKMLAAAKEHVELNRGYAKSDLEGGHLKPEQVRANYIGHFYDNSPDELQKVFSMWTNRVWDKDTLGRHQEVRAFDTLREAEEWSKAQHAIDPNVPILKPLLDPLEINWRRGQASIDAREFAQYQQEIIQRYGKDMPLNPQDFADLAKQWPTTAHEATKIEALVDSGKVPRESIRGLTENGRKEYVRQTLLKAKSPDEVIDIMNKYGVENAPKQKRMIGELAEDGTPYVDFNFGKIHAQLPKSIVTDLTDLNKRVLESREFDHFMRYIDTSNNVFRTFVTVPFPSFHFRNAYSNIALGFADVGMSVLNPARHYDAYASLRGLEGNLVTKAGEQIPYKQIQQEMKQNGVIMSGRNLLEYTGEQGIERTKGLVGKAIRAPRKFGEVIENEARAAMYSIYRRRGDDVAAAADRVNQMVFDYTNLSHVEQKYFKRAIPFYTFTRKNLERQFRNITTKPGLTAAEYKVVRGRKDENENMRSWEGNAFKFRLNRDGNTLTSLSGVDLPVKQLDVIWRGDLASTFRQGLGMLRPGLQAPLVLAFGKVPFTGRETDRAESATAGRIIEHFPEPMQKWIGYKKETDAAGRPKYTFQGDRFYALFQAHAMSRLVSTSDRQFRKYADDPSWGPMLLDLGTGLRYQEMNLDEEKQKQTAERLRYLEKWAVGKGLAREYERTYIPKERQ